MMSPTTSTTTYTLSPAQIALYHSQGFLLVRVNEHNLIDPAQLHAWVQEVRSWPREHGKWMPYDEVTAEGKKQLMRTECFVDYHDALQGLLCGDALLGILGQLNGHPMKLFKDKINYKGPKGNGFNAHLDAPAYDHIGKIEHLTANICVDTATPENGCLEVVVGSHKWKDIKFIEGGRIHPEWEKEHDWLSIPLQPGDILFFGSHLAHRSGPNKTNDFRSMVYATYHSTADGLDLRDRYYADRRENFPPDHERKPDVNYDLGWKRYGFAAPFKKDDTEADVKATYPLGQSQGVPQVVS